MKKKSQNRANQHVFYFDFKIANRVRIFQTIFRFIRSRAQNLSEKPNVFMSKRALRVCNTLNALLILYRTTVIRAPLSYCGRGSVSKSGGGIR